MELLLRCRRHGTDENERHLDQCWTKLIKLHPVWPNLVHAVCAARGVRVRTWHEYR